MLLDTAAEGRVNTAKYKDLLRAFPHHGFTELYQLDTFYNALNPADQDSLNAATGGNLLERRTQDVLMIIENKSKCLTAGGNNFPKLRDNIQEYVSATAVNYNQGNFVYRPPGSGSLPSNIVANPKGKLKSITTRSGFVLDGPTIPIPLTITNPKVDERVEETLTDPDLSEDPLHLNIPYPSRMLKQKQQEKDEVQIHKFWQMFKQLHINITLADALILMPKYQKLLKALLSNKEKLQELANTPLNENCLAVILKKLPEKLGDHGKFLIPYGFSELKCKSLGDLGASINLMPLFVWKKLADFVIVDYESDPRVPLILGRPFLWMARALIDKESINLINVFNNSSEYFLEDLFSNQPSGNPTFLSHPDLTSSEVNIFDSKGGNVLPEKLLDLDFSKDLHPCLYVNPLSGTTTYSSYPLLEEFADELALITFPLKYDDDLQFDVESDLKEIEFLLHQAIDSIESVTENVYDDPSDSKGEKIKESKLLIDGLDLPCDFLPFEYDSFISQDFSRVDAKPSTNNEDKVFNPGFLRQEKPFEIITCVVQDKKLAISNAYLVLDDFGPPFYEPLFFKEVPRLMPKDFVLQSSFPQLH
nr:hypothetical protein [Tanacetum cinerariifolium]